MGRSDTSRVCQAMLLAAGHGRRMEAGMPLARQAGRPVVPKPLLEVKGRPLIEHHVLNLARAGVTRILINHGPRGRMIEQALGDGERYGLEIAYSAEGETPLETAGGVVQALGQLGEAPFLLINADVYTDVDFSLLRLPEEALAHLLLVDNPDHHPRGDFSLHEGWLGKAPGPHLTYSGVGLYRPALFAPLAPGVRPLAPLLTELAEAKKLSGEHFNGLWLDVGTPERLAEANRLTANPPGLHA